MHCVQDGGTEDQRKKYVPGVGVGNKVGGAMGIGLDCHLPSLLTSELVLPRCSAEDPRGLSMDM